MKDRGLNVGERKERIVETEKRVKEMGSNVTATIFAHVIMIASIFAKKWKKSVLQFDQPMPMQVGNGHLVQRRV